VLDNVRAGMCGALVLRGEPGMGKSALLDYAVERAADLQIVRTVAVESEMAPGLRLRSPVARPLPAQCGPAARAAAAGPRRGLRAGERPAGRSVHGRLNRADAASGHDLAAGRYERPAAKGPNVSVVLRRVFRPWDESATVMTTTAKGPAMAFRQVMHTLGQLGNSDLLARRELRGGHGRWSRVLAIQRGPGTHAQMGLRRASAAPRRARVRLTHLPRGPPRCHCSGVPLSVVHDRLV
jgi:hypothetical protein